MVTPPAGYVDVGVSKMLKGITRTLAALMVGPKGVGKSMATQALAHEMTLPVVRVDCHEDMGASHLLGAVRIQGGSTWIDVGLLPLAVEAANTYGEALLVLEEVNALSPAAQIILHSLLDDRKSVFVPSLQKSYALQPGAILRVVGSCNPPSYGGTHSLNEALRSRFAVLPVSYMQKEQEMVVLAPSESTMGIKVVAPPERKLLDFPGCFLFSTSFSSLTLTPNLILTYYITSLSFLKSGL
jgi:MoxR-like ATPase